MSISPLSYSPFDTESITSCVKDAMQKKGWGHLLPFVDSAKTVRRWDFDTWVGSFFFVAGERDYLRVFFSTLVGDHEIVNYVSWRGGEVETSFSEGAWPIKELQGFSPTEALRSDAKLIVRVFNNPRIWDSIYNACSAGVAAERAEDTYLFYTLVAEKSLLNPRVFFKNASFRPVKVDASELLTAHVVRTAHHYVDGGEIRDFMKRMLPVPTPAGRTVFISLEAEKRAWVNQRECISRFLREARPDKVVFNGMASPVAGRAHCDFAEQEKHERGLIADIISSSGLSLEVVNMFGYTFHEKVNEVRKCSFFLAPGGSAFVLPSLFGIPGVVFANTTMIDWRRDLDGPSVVRVPKESITDLPDQKGLYSYTWGAANESVSFRIEEAAFLESALPLYRATCA